MENHDLYYSICIFNGIDLGALGMRAFEMIQHLVALTLVFSFPCLRFAHKCGKLQVQVLFFHC